MKWVVLFLLLIPTATAIGVDSSVSIAGAGFAVQDDDITTPTDTGVRACAIVTCLERGMHDEQARTSGTQQVHMQERTERIGSSTASSDELPIWAVALPAVGLLAILAKLYAVGPGRVAAVLVGPGRLLGMGLMSRWAWPTDLENETRTAMMAFIEKNPGASIQDTRHHAAVAWGTAVYHLQRMERDGKLVSVRSGNHHRYWIAGSQEAGVRHAWAVLEQPTTAMIAGAVHESPGIHQGGLCEQLKLKTPTASKHLKRLVSSGLVITKRCSRYVMYAPTDRLEEVLRMRVATH